LPGVGAIVFKGRTDLLAERGGTPLRGWWSLPGGLVETGERLEEAVVREVREETGLIVEVVEFYGLFQRIMHDAKGRTEYHYLLADYICKVVGGTMKAGDDAARLEWVPRSRLKQYKMTEGTLDVIAEAFSRMEESRRALRKRT